VPHPSMGSCRTPPIREHSTSAGPKCGPTLILAA
jgi:hypothetical protein